MSKSGFLIVAALALLGAIALLILEVIGPEPEIRIDVPEVAAADPEETTVILTGEVPFEVEWIEPDTKPHEADSPDPSSEESKDIIQLSGTISVIDAKGIRHDGEDGQFALVLWGEEYGTYHEVTVKNGIWKAEVPREPELSVAEIELGGRLTFTDEDERLAIPPTGVLHLTARWPSKAVLHVIASDTLVELTSVELAVVEESLHDDDQHPGGYGITVLSNAASPIPLDKIEEESDYHGYEGRKYYFARSPGYAWNRLEVDFKTGGDHFLHLKPGGAVEVGVSGYDGKSPCVLRLRREDTEKNRKILEAWRQRVLASNYTEDEKRKLLERDPYSGWSHHLTSEIPIKQDGRILIESLAGGKYLISAEVGEWFRDPVMMGKTEAEVVSGRTTLATLLLNPSPDHTTVPLQGSVRIPSAWQIDAFSLTVELKDTPLTAASTHQFLQSRDFEQVVGSNETIYFWDAGSVQAGRYEFEVDPPFYLTAMEVGPAGLTDALIEVPPPGSVVIRVVDTKTLDDADVDSLWWNPERPEGISGGTVQTVCRSELTGLFEFDAPIGQIEAHVNQDRYRMFSYINEKYPVKPGLNRYTIEVQRTCGFIVIVRDEKKAMAWNDDWDVHPKSLDENSTSSFTGWSQQPDGMRITVGAPGRYTFEFPKVDGYRLVDKQEVDVKAGEFVRHVIVLERDI